MMNKLIIQPISLDMESRRRKFTDEQKLEILNQAEKNGVIAVLRDHRLSYSVFARWREKFMKNDTNKQEMLERNKTKSELKQFMEENIRLKRIIAEQVIELARKDEELKKSNSQYGRR
jgi:putative transposase